ncbi:MAG: pyruvate kinase alpha/beta domain-containing protein [Dehalococcoidales bacterium]
MEEKITYFETLGQDNTEETLRLATERAKARGINKIVLASTRGDTARRYAELLEGTGIKLVVVPHQYGFGETQRFPRELVTELEQKGHCVYFGTMLFHTDNFYGERAPSLIATVLRTFCQGMKVCHEIILMTVNGGCVASGEKVIAVTGTGRGADTAVVAIAAPTSAFHELHITEIICKPLETRSRPAGQQPPARRPEAETR